MKATQQDTSGLREVAIRARKHTTALLLAGALLALSGCSDDNAGQDTSASTPTSSAPSPSSDTSSNAEKAAVLAAYTSSWKAHTEAYSKASSSGTDLRKSTTFKALADIENNLSAMRKAGQVTTGKPVLHPRVVKVTAAKIPTATVTDCVDTTNWTLIDKATNKKIPLPTTRLTKYVSTATLEKWGTKWMVTEVTAEDQAC